MTTALITGGTAGVGLATGLALGRRGVRCCATYRWGSVDPDEVRARFAEAGAPEPVLVQSDCGSAEDTDALLQELVERTDGVDILVSNATSAPVVRTLDDLTLHGLQQSVRYGAWPLVALTKGLRTAFGRSPRYVVAMSSDGPDHFHPGYDAVAASKAMLETLVRYLATHLRPEGTRVNAVRSRGVPTASFQAVFGEEVERFARRHAPAHWWVPAEEVAGAVVALCSGRMDAVNGQVLVIDRGAAFADNLMRIYDEGGLSR
ncbi:MAG: SDR family oxidoreductase [Myxococcales bacterium]|nr:SDR family oxidoreductase [Myxococcales bacterium]